MSVINVTDNGWLVVWWKTISTFYMPKHSCQEHKIDVSHVWSQCMLFIDYWPIHCILTTRQIRKLIQNIHRPEVATIRISRVRHRPVARGTVCDTLGCNVHTHTRNEWPKWLCGEYECALVSIVRPFTWYTLYHYYWYAASYGTIRVNQVVRKRYQCFVWRLVGAAIAKCGDNEDTGASRVENMLRVLAARQWSQQLSKYDVDVHWTFACKYLTWWYLRIFAKLIACQWRFCRQVYKFLAADSSFICPKVVCL